MFDIPPCGVDGPPGPALVARLANLRVHELASDELVRVLRAWERVASWVVASQLPILTAVAGIPDGQDGGEDWGCEEVAAALHVSGRTAGSRLAVARALETLPETASALAAGRIGYWHAVVLTDELGSLEPTVATAVEACVLAGVAGQTPGALRRAIRRAAARVDPLSEELAHARAAAERSVRWWPMPDGMATLSATMPAADVAICVAALDALAHRTPDKGCRAGVDQGIDARRADGLVSLCAASLADPTHSDRGHPAVGIQIDLPTLLGLEDNPGELTGYGPIPASAARALAADGRWRRMVIDPLRGALLDVGRRSYTPSPALASFVRARDATCRFPGCPRSGARCDVDHAIPFRAGGTTDRANLGLLCRRHHRLKHEAGWQLQRQSDGACTWTSPAGARYQVPAPGAPPGISPS